MVTVNLSPTDVQQQNPGLLLVFSVILQVFFLDFGNTAHVACSILRELPSDLLSHPFQVEQP